MWWLPVEYYYDFLVVYQLFESVISIAVHLVVFLYFQWIFVFFYSRFLICHSVVPFLIDKLNCQLYDSMYWFSCLDSMMFVSIPGSVSIYSNGVMTLFNKHTIFFHVHMSSILRLMQYISSDAIGICIFSSCSMWPMKYCMWLLFRN